MEQAPWQLCLVNNGNYVAAAETQVELVTRGAESRLWKAIFAGAVAIGFIAINFAIHKDWFPSAVVTVSWAAFAVVSSPGLRDSFTGVFREEKSLPLFNLSMDIWQAVVLVFDRFLNQEALAKQPEANRSKKILRIVNDHFKMQMGYQYLCTVVLCSLFVFIHSYRFHCRPLADLYEWSQQQLTKDGVFDTKRNLGDKSALEFGYFLHTGGHFTFTYDRADYKYTCQQNDQIQSVPK